MTVQVAQWFVVFCVLQTGGLTNPVSRSYAGPWWLMIQQLYVPNFLLPHACGATGGQNQSQRHRYLVQDSQIRWWEAAESFKAYNLAVQWHADRNKNRNNAGAIVIDEWFQLVRALFHASSLRATAVWVSFVIWMIEVSWMDERNCGKPTASQFWSGVQASCYSYINSSWQSSLDHPNWCLPDFLFDLSHFNPISIPHIWGTAERHSSKSTQVKIPGRSKILQGSMYLFFWGGYAKRQTPWFVFLKVPLLALPKLTRSFPWFSNS